MPRILDQFGRKKCKKKRKDMSYRLLKQFFQKYFDAHDRWAVILAVSTVDREKLRLSQITIAKLFQSYQTMSNIFLVSFIWKCIFYDNLVNFPFWLSVFPLYLTYLSVCGFIFQAWLKLSFSGTPQVQKSGLFSR